MVKLTSDRIIKNNLNLFPEVTRAAISKRSNWILLNATQNTMSVVALITPATPHKRTLRGLVSQDVIIHLVMPQDVIIHSVNTDWFPILKDVHWLVSLTLFV